jgi:serine/threonine protein kinase
MATIFRATDLGTNQTVAIKVPHPEMECDPVFFERFQREARIGREMSHPGGAASIGVVTLSGVSAQLRNGHLDLDRAPFTRVPLAGGTIPNDILVPNRPSNFGCGRLDILRVDHGEIQTAASIVWTCTSCS